MLDCAVAPMFELLVLMEGGAYHNVFERLKVRETAPNLIDYLERFRAHELIRPYRFSKVANDAHCARSRGWDKSVKCQLSLEVLENAFTD